MGQRLQMGMFLRSKKLETACSGLAVLTNEAFRFERRYRHEGKSRLPPQAR